MRTLQQLFGSLFLSLSAVAVSQPVTYEVDGKSYEGYYVSPAKNSPVVFILHDWNGLDGYEIKRANMLAEQGYTVFAADLYGKGIRPTELEQKQQLTTALSKDRAKMRRLIQAAVNTAKAQGADISNAVMMGYCFGGGAVLEYARSGAEMKGFVTFHGALRTPEGESYVHTKGSILVFHGSADTSVTLQDLAQLGTELEQYHIPHELISYGGAPHAFTVFGTDRYRQDADEKSWQRFLDYLKATLPR